MGLVLLCCVSARMIAAAAYLLQLFGCKYKSNYSVAQIFFYDGMCQLGRFLWGSRLKITGLFLKRMEVLGSTALVGFYSAAAVVGVY